MDAKEYAEALAEFFLKNGNYIGAKRMPSRGGGDSAQSLNSVISQQIDTLGFGGLPVESVGYEVREGDVVGSEVNVHITGRGKPRKIDKNGQVINILPTSALPPIDLKRFSTSPNRGHVYERGGRIACGSSCAPAGEEHSGTLGALVRKNSDEEIYILSNNHVIASCNQAQVGTHIMSPSNADYRPGATAPTEIGNLSYIIELHSIHYSHTTPSLFDAALAKAISEKLTSWQGDELDGYDTPTNILKPFTGLEVKKYGRTTKLTEGIVLDKVAIAKPIEYRHNTFAAISWFANIWSLGSSSPGEAFSLPGDSGSLVVTSDNASAIGIIFAGGKGLSYMIPLQELSSEMGFQLVTGHGV